MKPDQLRLLVVVCGIVACIALYGVLKPAPDQPKSFADPSQWHTDEREMAATQEHLRQLAFEFEGLATPVDAERSKFYGCLSLAGEITQPDVSMAYAVPLDAVDVSIDDLVDELEELGWVQDPASGSSDFGSERHPILRRDFDGWEAKIDVRPLSMVGEGEDTRVEVTLTGTVEDAEPCTAR